MDWMRENKTLAAILGVMVAGALGLSAWLVMSYFGYSASLEQYETVGNSVATLKGAKLYPSEEHVQAREAAVTEYEAAVSSLGSVLLALQQPVKPMSDTEFQAHLKKRIAETRQAADARILSDNTKVKLPKEFAFGFDKYTTQLPRSGEAASQLGDYLAAADAVTNMFIDSGVSSIDSFERTSLAIESDAPAPKAVEPPKETKKAPAPAKAGKNAKPAAKKTAPPKEIAKIVERRTVTLTLTAEQGALQILMNKLASPSEMVHFTVVRHLAIANEKQEGPLRGSLKLPPPQPPAGPEPTPEGEAATPKKAGEPAAPEKPRVIEPVKAAQPDAQAVFGEEKLKVYMEIDLVRFLEPKSDEAAR